MKKKMLIPPRLKSGDTIGIAAPAGHFKKEPFRRGLAVLASMGFHTVVPDDLFIKEGIFAGSDQHRAELLIKLFEDRNIDAIICARGGFGSITCRQKCEISVQANPSSGSIFLVHGKSHTGRHPKRSHFMKGRRSKM